MFTTTTLPAGTEFFWYVPDDDPDHTIPTFDIPTNGIVTMHEVILATVKAAWKAGLTFRGDEDGNPLILVIGAVIPAPAPEHFRFNAMTLTFDGYASGDHDMIYVKNQGMPIAAICQTFMDANGQPIYGCEFTIA